MSETSEITNPGIEFINSLPGCHARRAHCGRVRVRGGWLHLGESGYPDIDAHINGWWICWETKTEDGRLSSDQRKTHGRIRSCGGVVYVTRSIEELKLQALEVYRSSVGRLENGL